MEGFASSSSSDGAALVFSLDDGAGITPLNRPGSMRNARMHLIEVAAVVSGYGALRKSQNELARPVRADDELHTILGYRRRGHESSV